MFLVRQWGVPACQVMRILFMVPIYAVTSCLALRLPESQTMYLVIVRELCASPCSPTRELRAGGSN